MLKGPKSHISMVKSSQSSAPSVKKSMAAPLKKSERCAKHIDKDVEVSNYGRGILRSFEDSGDEKICGVELNEPKGDCDGEDLDGNRHFSCEANFGVFVTMKEVTLLDSEGNAIIKKTTKSIKPKTKKKFEDPPSLRKKIVRKDNGTTRKANPSTKAPKSSVHSIRTKGQKVKKVDHLAKPKQGVVKAMQGFQDADRKVIRRAPTNSTATATIESNGNTEEPTGTPENEENDNSLENAKKMAKDVPEDWMEAAKREKREKEEAIAREKELADLKAQEERIREAELLRIQQEEEFNRQAEEEAKKRDQAREERKVLKEKRAADRATKRAEQEAAALAMVDEYAKVQEMEYRQREEKAKTIHDTRMAQKARISALMNRVKKNKETTTTPPPVDATTEA